MVKISVQLDVVYSSYYPKTPQNVPNWVLNQRKCCFFCVKSRMENTQKLKLDIQKVYMDGPILGYVRISDDPLGAV